MSLDSTGRCEVDSRVLDVDPDEGLSPASHVSSIIDVMETARADARGFGRIGVAVPAGTSLGRAAGRRREVQVLDEHRAVVRYLTESGLLQQHAAVIIVDCGDTGVSFYTVAPETGRVSRRVRSTALSGRELDRRLMSGDGVAARGTRVVNDTDNSYRSLKEEVYDAGARSGAGHVTLSAAAVEEAARPMIEAVAAELADYAQASDPVPDAIVLVGGLANIPVIGDACATATGLDVTVAPSPELAGAVGAALLVRDRQQSGARRGGAAPVTIGGRFSRATLAAVPVAVGVAAACAVFTVVNLTGASADHDSPLVSPQPAPPTVADASHLTSNTSPRAADTPPTGTLTRQPENDEPGWRTTQLAPPPLQPTRTLLPTTLPTRPSQSPKPTAPSSPTPPSTTPPSTTSPSTTPPTPNWPWPSGVPLPSQLLPPGVVLPPSGAPKAHDAPARVAPTMRREDRPSTSAQSAQTQPAQTQPAQTQPVRPQLPRLPESVVPTPAR